MPEGGGLAFLHHITVVGEHLQQQTQNGFYFKTKEGNLFNDAVESIQNLVQNFQTWVLTPFATPMSSSWHGVGIIGSTLIPRNGPYVELPLETLTGGQGADSLPSDAACCVAVKSGFSGRSNSGRIYVPAISRASVEGNFFTPDFLASVSAFNNALLSRFGRLGSSLGHEYVLYSPKLGNVRNAGPPPFIQARFEGVTFVQTMIARGLVCSQKHRRADHGQ